jgi:hypothetical protein
LEGGRLGRGKGEKVGRWKRRKERGNKKRRIIMSIVLVACVLPYRPSGGEKVRGASCGLQLLVFFRFFL